MINARSETAHVKPSFRGAFRKRRCLIPADGFYEWKREGSTRTPYFIGSSDGGLLAFAGLFESWSGSGETVESCTILTVEPNELLAPIHNRMPAILAPEDYDGWLDPANEEVDSIRALLTTYPASAMAAHPVSTYVNNPRNDTPRCLQPAN